MTKSLRICYMGMTRPDFSRSGVYRPALREQGVLVHDCFTEDTGVRRFSTLFQKHWAIRDDYDVLVVAYPGYILVWFARLVSRRPIIFDALCTLWEAETYSHGAGTLTQLRARCIDWVAVHCASVVLVESVAQQRFFQKRFGGNPEKYQVVYTGVSESVVTSVSKRHAFTVVFRGRLTYESGIEYLVHAAQLLSRTAIQFRIVGHGYKLAEVQQLITTLGISNVEIVTERLSDEALRAAVAECHVSIGQVSTNPRLARTIPHKAFESMLLGVPYITARTEAVGEIFHDGVSCSMVPSADPQALADAILALHDNPARAESLQQQARLFFDSTLSRHALGQRLVSVVLSILRT